MNLRIIAVRDKGDLEKERLVLSVSKDDNTLGYVVMDTTFDADGDVSNKGRHAYRFPEKEISAGDFVVLYTRAKPNGWSTESVAKDSKTKTHFFYWGRETTVWNQDGDRCTLMYIVDSKAV